MSEGSYISFGVEGVPYSQVRVEIVGAERAEGAIGHAVYWARMLADEYAKAFPETRQEARGAANEPEWGGSAPPPPDEEYAPSEPLRVAIDANGDAQFEGGVKVTGERFACPDCRGEAKPSIERYQEWQRGNDGRMYAQKWFCPNNNCSTKSLWRSKLVPLVGVDTSR